MYIEYRVYGYILGAGTVLYLAGSLRYPRIKQLFFNAPSLQCKSTLYTVFRCILQLLTRQYNVEKSSFKLLYIEYRVYGYIVGACTVPYMAGSLTYRRINTCVLSRFKHSLQWKSIISWTCTITLSIVYSHAKYSG